MNKVSNASNSLIWVEGWGRGGIESFLKSLLSSRSIKSAGVKPDLFVVCDWSEGGLEDIRPLCNKVDVVFEGERPGLFKKAIHAIPALSRQIGAGNYEVVYVNATNGMAFLYSFIAMIARVPVRIIHSHTAGFDDPSAGVWLKTAVHRICCALFGWTATVRLATSEPAGAFLFDDKPFRVLPNGIDLGRFRFSETYRKDVRDCFDISDDSVVLGSVGRLEPVKNPLFQVSIFKEFHDIYPNSYLIMVGSGCLYDGVMQLIANYGLSEHVFVVEGSGCPERYYSAMDCYLMPSIAEGFGISSVEAQCSGLRVLASMGVPSEISFDNMVTFLSLENAPVVWAEKLCILLRMPTNRHDVSRLMQGTGFDSEITASSVVQVVSDWSHNA